MLGLTTLGSTFNKIGGALARWGVRGRRRASESLSPGGAAPPGRSKITRRGRYSVSQFLLCFAPQLLASSLAAQYSYTAHSQPQTHYEIALHGKQEKGKRMERRRREKAPSHTSNGTNGSRKELLKGLWEAAVKLRRVDRTGRL